MTAHRLKAPVRPAGSSLLAKIRAVIASKLGPAIENYSKGAFGAHTPQNGFTLVEVLVALAILAITMAAVSRTASSSIHHADALRTRVIADWVAQNRLALRQARGDWLPVGIQTGSEEQAGLSYPWQEEVTSTPNPTMRRIVVRVYAPGDAKQSLRELTGYLAQSPR